jgi:succinylglutamate desuccinylase
MLLPDFEEAARCLRARGWWTECGGPAIWRFRRAHAPPRLRLLVTAGVHGDETAPIEMLARRLTAWAKDADSLSVDLFVALANLPAVMAGKRFIRYDMNRMFGDGRIQANWGAESVRAELLALAIVKAMRSADRAPVVHLDLHATIRPSLKPTATSFTR